LAGAPGAFLDSLIDARGQLTTFDYERRYFTPIFQVRPPHQAVRDTARFRDVWRRAAPREGYGRPQEPLERLVRLNQLRGTYYPFAGYPTDYRADAFSAPTWVRQVAPEPIMTWDYLMISFGVDEVRDIGRDSTGHVTKIVVYRDSASFADSVVYEYDANFNVSRIIRPTALWPTGSVTLDTLRFTYDSVTSGLLFTHQRCVRLRASYDVLGVRADTVAYGANGIAQCLPTQIVGNANDTTRFTYGQLTAGTPAGSTTPSVAPTP
jgi:hypothetical protein